MNKRAKEVADRFKTRQSDLRSVRGGRSSFYSGRRGFRSLIGGRSRFPLSRYRGGFRSAPPPPLNPPGDWSVGVRVNIVPVGGRLSLFMAQWQNVTRDHFIASVVRQGLQISVQNYFLGVLREVTVPPRDPKAHLAICKEIQELILKKAIVQIDDFSLLCFSPIFVIPKKTGSSGDFESEENLCFHFGTTFPYGNSQCHSTESAPSRLGSLDRFEGRLPSRTDTPSVQETAGFQIPRQDLRLQGLAFRPKRLRGSFRGQ